jgi:endonuclease-8
MPEGPSIVIVKDAVKKFCGKRILKAAGNAKIDTAIMENKIIRDSKSWGKHLLICFDDFTIRIHFLMFGTYRINEKKETTPRLSLQFKKGELNFYTCSIKIINENLDEVYDWSADTMNKTWDPKKALKKLRSNPTMMACDALLDQDIFAGVGNIIKNEVLFRIFVHPESLLASIPISKRKQLVAEAVNYSFEFLNWKKAFVLKKHWLVYNKKICVRCHIPLEKKHLGKNSRRSFFCNNCQVLYE